ncbi:MAG TPA: HAD-IA family hydrolase [Acidobacteriota bacterium]|nr:HAD-IA family hydrolase [Acidobacteriota bacterium]
MVRRSDCQAFSGRLRSGIVEAVFFDAAGTLFDLRRSAGFFYLEFARRHGFEPAHEGLTEKELEESFQKEFRKSPPLSFPGAESSSLVELERNWWYRIVVNVFEKWGHFAGFDSFFDEIYSFFGTAEPWVLEEGCLELLDYLRAGDFQMGVISNFDSRLFGLLEELRISKYFQCVTISSQSLAAKPDPRIFQAAVARIGLEESQCLHLGDRLSDDFEGARGAGLQAVLYDPDGRCKDRSVIRITKLTELCQVLV